MTALANTGLTREPEITKRKENVEKRFYYLRDQQNRPLITVCIVWGEDEAFARGVAICSPNDNVEKKIGRDVAARYAMIALHKGRYYGEYKENYICRDEALIPVDACYEVIEDSSVDDIYKTLIYHMEYDPFLSDYERKLFKL